MEGSFLKHSSCPYCGGSDPVALYLKEIDGEDVVDGWCFSCNTYVPPDEVDMEAGEKMNSFNPSDFDKFDMRGWKTRRVGKPVSELYGIRTELDEHGDAIRRFYPITENGNIVGYKIRDCKKKDFFSVGKNKNTCQMFGQHLFPAGGKFLVICGGEEDAASLQQAMWQKNPNYTTAIISPTTGEAGTAKQIKANYEWVTSFEKIVFMLDNDEAGRKATEEALKVLKPGQGYVAKLNLKDPNEYLQTHREGELVAAFWKAERYSPVDLMTLGQMWDEFQESAKKSIIPFPAQFAQLNKMLGGGIAYGEVTVIGSLTSIGKGQPLWENVVTPTGYRKVGDISVGDYLIGSNGRPTKVVGVYPQGTKKVFKITLNDGSTTYCDDSHLWAWQSQYDRWKGRDFRVTNVYEIMDFMSSGRSRPQVYLPDNPIVEWDEVELPVDPYLVGVLIGDGSLVGNFGLSNSEGDIQDKVLDLIRKYDLTLNSSNGKNWCMSGKKGRENKLSTALGELNLLCKSPDKIIPPEYLSGSVDQRLAVLRGLMDTDGTVSPKGTANMEFSTTSETLATQVKFLVRSLGGTARIVKRNSFYKKDGERKQTLDSYRVFIKQPRDVFYFSSEKHKSRFKQGRTYARNEVVSIEKFSEEPTVCFKVEAEDSLYLTNDFIVTHNSTIINNLVYSFFTHTDEKIGLLYLESTPREIVNQLLSIHLEENLALKDPKHLDMKRLKDEFVRMVKDDDRIVSIDHQGAFASTEELFNKVEWMVKSMGTKIVLIDPLQAAVPSNENAQIDEFMDKVLKLAKQTDCSIIVVSHMRKPEGKDPHDVSEYMLKGSSSINQIAFNTILLSRDKTSDDENIRNATRLQVVKCRRTGFTGEAGWLRYDPERAKLTTCDNPYNTIQESQLMFGETPIEDVKTETF